MSLWSRRFLWGLGFAAVVYGMVCIDVILRAKHAYLEGEKAASAKDAYAWYESAATQFTPPESRWTRLAREKMPIAKEKWKAELRAKHVPFNESMLE